MALPTQQRCRSSRFQPYTGCGANTGAVTRYNGYKAVNPFLWPRQEQSKQSWWGPSVYGPPWWSYPVTLQATFFPCNIVALVRTTHASIGIIRHFVGFLAKCKSVCPVSGEPREQEVKVTGPCGKPGHDHSKEPPFYLSRFWLSTEMGVNPSKQELTVICNARPNSTEIQTVVLGPSADGTAVDAETGEVALVSRDGESGETTLVSAVKDLTKEIVLTQSLYEIDLRRQYFSDPAKYGYLLRELEQFSQPPSRRLTRRLDSSKSENAHDVLEAIPVDAEQLLQICAMYGFSEAETRRVVEHFMYVQRSLQSPREGGAAPLTNRHIGARQPNESDPALFKNRSPSARKERGPSFSAALNGGFGAGAHHHQPRERFYLDVSSTAFGPTPRVENGFGGDMPARDPSCQIVLADPAATSGDGADVEMEVELHAAAGDFLTRNAELLGAGENARVHLIEEGGGGMGARTNGDGMPYDADSGETW